MAIAIQALIRFFKHKHSYGPNTTSPRYQAFFKFTFTVTINSSGEELLFVACLLLDRHDLPDRRRCFETIFQHLRSFSFPMEEDGIQQMIDAALDTASWFTEGAPPTEVIHVEVPGYAVYEKRNQAGNSMVPTDNRAIESLVMKKVSSMDTDEFSRCGKCMICLEEFQRDDEAVSMECSHIFHGDCMKKWLYVSYYCPVCRFEMPKARY